MTRRAKYISYLLLVHAVLLGMAIALLQAHKPWLLAVEAVLLVSVLMGYRLMVGFERPARLIRQGVEAIRARDFQNTFPPTDVPELQYLVEAYNDMMARIRAERQAIQAEHFFLEKLIEASPAGILILDYDDRVAYLNPAARRLLKLTDEVTDQPLVSLTHPLIGAVAGLEAGESQVVALNGLAQYRCQVAHFIHRGFARRFLLIEELTRELLENEKKAYGKVIRMMAHEVNNSIGAINSILQSVLEMQQEPGPPPAGQVARVLQVAISRNEHLNRFMQNFAQVIRVPPVQLAPFALHEVATRVHTLMTPRAQTQGTLLVLDLPPEPVWARMDLLLMEQAVLNIVQNALESLGQGGEIILQVVAHPSQLIIADNGPGISPAQAPLLFTPFFSSKPNGQGIGLSLVREILTQHAVSFSLQTAADGWTRFRMEWTS